jgi:3-dehydroshikimate dehydratase
MNISLCTITFRHHLLSLKDIARWAQEHDFQGIELWGAHARNIEKHLAYDADWLDDFGLSVPMLSDYLPTDADRRTVCDSATALCRAARRWRAGKIRTFAGKRGSHEVDAGEWATVSARLRDMCAIAADHGLLLLVETHPNTLADSTASTIRLIESVDHPAFAINFDALHLWEAGDDPVLAHSMLQAYTAHYHLKNVRSRDDLNVFEPANVYAAAGRREGMTPLFEGKMDYVAFLEELSGAGDVDASLEWFGNDCFDVLRRDRRAIRRLADGVSEPLRAGAA